MPTDEHDETSKIEESASALLSTIDAYKKIADSLPISEELKGVSWRYPGSHSGSGFDRRGLNCH